MLLPAFGDVERAVCEALSHLASVGTETSPRLQHELPFIHVVRIGGSDDRVTDRARIDVHVYAAGSSEAKRLAEAVRQHLTSGPIATTCGVIDRAVTEVGPQPLPAADSDDLRRVVATYRVSMRRRPPPRPLPLNTSDPSAPAPGC